MRQIAHHLRPIVSVGESGVSDAVIAETRRALADHELIKIRLHAESREDRELLASALLDACGAEMVQKIGKVLVLYLANPKPNPDLSNVLRAQTGR